MERLPRAPEKERGKSFFPPRHEIEIQTEVPCEPISVRTAFLTPEPHAESGVLAREPAVRRLDRSLASAIREDQRLNRFRRCLLATGLLEDLDEPGPFTVFAPMDACFDFPQGVFDTWFSAEGTSSLFDVAEFHVTRGLLFEAPVPPKVPSLEGRSVALRWEPQGLIVNQQALVLETWLTKNGLLHFVDRVLVPSGIQLGPDGRLMAEPRDRPSGVRLVHAEPRLAENLGAARVVE